MTSSGALYTNLETAIENQKFWFDGMCEEMRHHHTERRKTEQAFCYIQVVSGVTDDTPEGEDAYDSLNAEMLKKIDATYMTLDGKDTKPHM